MYIEITQRCNMNCAHCAVDAKATGEDMTFETFKQTITACKELECEAITLGGGEPTLHPQFMEMVEYGVSVLGENCIGIVTNGSNTEIALHLADLTEQGIVCASISIDPYHDPIDAVVVDRYENLKKYPDSIFVFKPIKTVESVMAGGRGKAIEGAEDICLGRGIRVRYDGGIYACGCYKELLGTVYEYSVPLLDCSMIDHNKYICKGYCSERGHKLLDNPEHIRKELMTAKIQRKKAEISIEIFDILQKGYPRRIEQMALYSLMMKHRFTGVTPEMFKELFREAVGIPFDSVMG